MAVPNFENFDPDFADPSQWAAMYRAYGLQVIPGHMPAEGKSWKRPYLAEWTSLQQALVPDATFRRWYDPATGEYRNRRNMGIITGACSGGAFIIDLDLHKLPAAAVWWNGVCAVHNNGMVPETPTQQTGGGGLQLLFRAPPGWTPPTNKTDRGVDLRGQAGFAVMPSSLHESGKSYEWLPGRAPWEIAILEAPAWLCEEIDRLIGTPHVTISDTLKAATNQSENTANLTAKTTSGGEFDAFGHRIDGREEAMRDMVWRCVVKLRRACPIAPTAVEQAPLMVAEYAVYERTVSVQSPRPGEGKATGLEREGRGLSAWAAKWAYAMRQWDGDVARAAAEPDPHPEEPPDPAAEFAQAAQQAKQAGAVFEYLNIEQILAMADPKWLIDRLMIEHSLGIIYGPPGSLKTFISLDVALSLATKQQQWWGYGIQHTGTVVYISSEGIANLKFRIQAWAQHRGVDIAKAPFRLIRQSINFMKPEDVGVLLNTVQAIVDEAGPVAAVFVDTVSRVLPGAKENQQEDMSLFVAACDQVRNRFLTTVIGLHHTNYAGGLRGSTVIPGAGDFLIETRREAGDMHGSIYVKKVKDGEDGWEKKFTVTKVALGDIGGRSSLVVDPDDNPAAAAGDWPDKDVLRKVLVEINKAWLEGKPWSASPNSRDRYAGRVMWVKFSVSAKLTKSIIETWLITGVLSEEIINSHSKARGLKVVGSID